MLLQPTRLWEAHQLRQDEYRKSAQQQPTAYACNMQSEPISAVQLDGYKRDTKWTDMSDWLVHFTRDQGSLASILAARTVRADRPLGWAVYYEGIENQNSACFSEVPIKDMDRLIKHRSAWGIAFRRDFIVSRGGNRVWYLEEKTPAYEHLANWARKQKGLADATDPLWKITPFVDRLQPGRHEWDWEREWRVPGGLTFEVSDVAFIITPAQDVSAVVSTNIPEKAAWLQYRDEETYWLDVLSALSTGVDRQVASFLAAWDPAVMGFVSGELAPGITLLDTKEAVDRHFGDLENDVREEILQRLNAESEEWVVSL